MQRRNFLEWMLKGFAAALGAFVAYPVARYLVPPKMPEAATRRVVAAKKGELAPGSFKTFPFGDQPGILVRKPNGEYTALSAVCTHLGCTVQYRSGENVIWCACHNGMYTLEGGNISGPPPRPLEKYDVHEQGDEIVIEKAGQA